MRSMPDEERPAGDPYYIQASSVAADRPKLVLKHNEAFLVADSRGDFPDIPESEFGFYVDGTRFLSQLELVMHGHPPLVLNAALSEDTLQIAVDLTNPDILHDGGIALPGRMLRIARLLTITHHIRQSALPAPDGRELRGGIPPSHPDLALRDGLRRCVRGPRVHARPARRARRARP